MPLSRRSFLRDASSTAAAATLGLSGCAHPRAAAKLPAPAITIAQAGRRTGILAGSAVDVRALRTSAPYADLIRTQCAIVVAENAMKFGPLHPDQNRFFFDDADYLVEFAQRNGILVRGHNFVWHRQLPGWFGASATAANAEQILVDHIEHVAGRYRGRIHSWDVCNEVIHLEDHQPGGLRASPWYTLLGPRYIDVAFQAARRADPHALLCYNDYGIESESPADAAKRASVLALLRGMQARGVPIDAVGIQGHISAGPNRHYGPSLTRFMAEVQALGLKLFVSEMDVNDRELPPSEAARDAGVAATYAEFLQATLANQALIMMLTWGLTDRYTWLNGEDSRADHLPERCLPFDSALQPLPALNAEIHALLQAPPRPLLLNRI